jgi:TRAP-type transport system periplasmic protein
MQDGLSRRTLGRAALATAATFGILRHARGEEALRLRCSLDTAPSHIRNVSVVDYLKKVEAATGGKIAGEVFHAGALFADLNVGKALIQGQVDMAVPGGWTQTGIVPDCDFVQMPAFYGRKIETTWAACDGKPGQHVSAALATKLRSHMLGPWFSLGFQNWYTTKTPIKSLADLKGLKLRSPGGAGIAWRIAFVGGIPNTTAWPNVPLALSQGTFDGFVSTDESCFSAKLWEAGVKYSYADHQYAGMYIPFISDAFWSKLTPDLQATMTKIWADSIPTYRANAQAAQERGRKALQDNGVTIVDPSEAELTADRTRMQADVATLIKDAKLSPEVVKLVQESVGA